MAESLGLFFIETSAKEEDNVQEAFKQMALKIKNDVTPEVIQFNRADRIKLETVRINKYEQKDKNKCCF